MTDEETVTIFVSKCHHAELRKEVSDDGTRADFYCPVCGEHCGFFFHAGTGNLDLGLTPDDD